MAAPMFTVTLTGHKPFLRGLRSLQQPELKTVVRPAMRDAAKRVTVPAIKKKAVFQYKHKGVKGKRGRKGPIKRSVTAKYIKARAVKSHGAFAGVNVAPRAWYAKFVGPGTAYHSVAKDARLDTSTFQDRPPWVQARSNDFVTRGGRESLAATNLRVNRLMFVNYKKLAKAK